MTATNTAAGVRHTPGPWEYVPSSEYHGPYVTSEFGNTICDFYVMSNPGERSVLNGGPSRPIPHMEEMADANARLTSVAPDMLAVLKAIKTFGELANVCVDDDYTGGKKPASKDVWQFPRHMLVEIDDAIARAEGREPKPAEVAA